MATSSTPRKRTASKAPSGKAAAKPGTASSGRAAPNTGTAQRETTAAAAGPAAAQDTGTAPRSGGGGRTITFTLPSMDRVASGAAEAAMLPVTVARQVIPGNRGLPVYLGLGVLGAADVIEWPLAIGLGLGYAALRRGGLLPRASTSPTRPAPAA